MITRTLEVQNRQENSGFCQVPSLAIVEEFFPYSVIHKDVVNLWAGR